MSRNTKQQNQLRDQFIDFTQTTSSIATQFLRSANWDLELAINEFLSHASGYGSGNSKESKSLDAVFDKYKEDENKIGIDGTLQYLEDLGVDPEDKVTLALAEFLESPSMGTFLKKPFVLKWHSVHAQSLHDMKSHVKILADRLLSDEYLKQVYRFTFTFLLEGGRKTLPLETAADYWRLLLRERYGTKIDEWIQFLETDWKQAVSKDTWNMFFLFIQEWGNDPKLINYDENAAWPSLIDEFVESYRGKISK